MATTITGTARRTEKTRPRPYIRNNMARTGTFWISRSRSRRRMRIRIPFFNTNVQNVYKIIKLRSEPAMENVREGGGLPFDDHVAVAGQRERGRGRGRRGRRRGGRNAGGSGRGTQPGAAPKHHFAPRRRTRDASGSRADTAHTGERNAAALPPRRDEIAPPFRVGS